MQNTAEETRSERPEKDWGTGAGGTLSPSSPLGRKAKREPGAGVQDHGYINLADEMNKMFAILTGGLQR